MTGPASSPNVLAIGWDVGGWEGDRQGLAAFRFVDGRPTLIAARADCLPKKGSLTLSEFVAWAIGEPSKQHATERLILAIDAPFGFPRSLRNLLNGTPVSEWMREGQISNPYAFRWTDRVIHSRFKTPLSASFDKLGNNATVAMHHLAIWRRESGLRVLPFDTAEDTASIAIEVYPAIVRAGAGGARPQWYHQLAPDWADASGDAADAVVCAALALAWAFAGQWGLPHLEAPPADCRDDGWIFYPSGSEWSREGRDIHRLSSGT
jgi:hypothetical protein